LSQNVTDSLIS